MSDKSATEQSSDLKPFLKQIEDNLRDAILNANSPYTDRRGAAAYCCVEVSSIDKAANDGKITRHRGTGKPMFKKSGGKGSLDLWIEGKAIAQQQASEVSK